MADQNSVPVEGAYYSRTSMEDQRICLHYWSVAAVMLGASHGSSSMLLYVHRDQKDYWGRATDTIRTIGDGPQRP